MRGVSIIAGVRRLSARIPPALALLTLLSAAGCATSANARFYTELTQPGRLSAGAPVVNLGTPIGSVAKVWPLADGNTGVAFDVDRADADAIRRDSIMVLSDNPAGASLDVMTTNPFSSPASPGTQIDGASTQNDANSLVAAKNLAAGVPAMAMMGSVPATNPALMNVSPTWLQLQQQIAVLQSRYLIAGVQSAGIAAQQLRQVNQNAAALERQLIAAGHSAEAEQLRRQVDALANTFTTPPSWTMPPAGPMPPAAKPPPAHKPHARTKRGVTAPPAHATRRPPTSTATLVIPPAK